MENLPENTIFNKILPWLPAKTLVRFKGVSPRWNDFISSTHFAKTHFEHPSYLSSRSVITHNIKESPSFFESFDHGTFDKMGFEFDIISDRFEHEFTDNFVHLIGSSNGLLFLISTNDVNGVDVEGFPDEFHYIIYNPCLGVDAYVRIEDEFHNHFVIGRNHDEFLHNFSFGFDYVKSLDDYCIVAIGLPSNPRNPNIVVCVYSLRHGEWRPPRTFREHRLPMSFLENWWKFVGAMVNDALHWLINVGPNEKFIAAFDLIRDEFRMMGFPYPELGNDESIDWFSLSSMKDCLCFWGCHDDGNVDLWMMREYGVVDSWVYMSRFNVGQDVVAYSRDWFGLTESGKLLVYSDVDGYLVLVDFSNDEPEYVELDCDITEIQTVNYVQSLESPLALFANQETRI